MARAAAPGSLLSVIGARVENATIGNRNAPVLATSDAETQIQVPFDVAGASVQLAAATPTGNRELSLTILPASPSIHRLAPVNRTQFPTSSSDAYARRVPQGRGTRRGTGMMAGAKGAK